jgi:protein SCO1/2
MSSRTAGIWALVAGAILAAGGGYLVWLSFPGKPLPAGEIPRVLEEREDVLLPAFRLQGTHGEFANDKLSGRWTFMFFGYTQCPDICPTALALMKDLKRQLEPNVAVSPAPTFQVVFVSVDPRRDTRELLAQYMAAFDPSFIGASGADAELAPLTATLGIRYQRHDETDRKNYTVDHSAAIHLIDPRGRLAAVFPPPQEASRMAIDFRRIVARGATPKGPSPN